MGANVFSRPPDPARPTQIVHAGQGLPVRFNRTMTDTPESPWNSLTRKRPQVQILYRPPGKTPSLALKKAGIWPSNRKGQGRKVRLINAPR